MGSIMLTQCIGRSQKIAIIKIIIKRYFKSVSWNKKEQKRKKDMEWAMTSSLT